MPLHLPLADVLTFVLAIIFVMLCAERLQAPPAVMSQRAASRLTVGTRPIETYRNASQLIDDASDIVRGYVEDGEITFKILLPKSFQKR